MGGTRGGDLSSVAILTWRGHTALLCEVKGTSPLVIQQEDAFCNRATAPYREACAAIRWASSATSTASCASSVLMRAARASCARGSATAPVLTPATRAPLSAARVNAPT